MAHGWPSVFPPRGLRSGLGRACSRHLWPSGMAERCRRDLLPRERPKADWRSSSATDEAVSSATSRCGGDRSVPPLARDSGLSTRYAARRCPACPVHLGHAAGVAVVEADAQPFFFRLLGHLPAPMSGLREADGNGLLATCDFLAGPSGFQRATLHCFESHDQSCCIRRPLAQVRGRRDFNATGVALERRAEFYRATLRS
jgi:hypothetical protein